MPAMGEMEAGGTHGMYRGPRLPRAWSGNGGEPLRLSIVTERDGWKGGRGRQQPSPVGPSGHSLEFGFYSECKLGEW